MAVIIQNTGKIAGSSNTVHYGTCSTAASTAGKVVTCEGFKLATGSRVAVKFTVTNTATNSTVTLNVNNTGAKPVYYRNSGTAWSAGILAANRTYEFVYNGAQYEFVGDIDTGSNNVTQTNTTTSGSYPILFKYTANTTNETRGARYCSKIIANPSTGQLSATTLRATSDYNLKNIQCKIDNANLSNISAYQYSFKDDQMNEQHIGLIAQQVQQYYPQAVSIIDDQGHLGIDYNAIVALLVCEVNELKSKVNDLQLKINKQ